MEEADEKNSIMDKELQETRSTVAAGQVHEDCLMRGTAEQ